MILRALQLQSCRTGTVRHDQVVVCSACRERLARGAGSFRVCYASDTLVWTDRNGLVIGDDEALGTPSLLRDCPKSPTVANMPCQLPTKMSKTTGTRMFLSPPGATRGRS